MRYEPSKTDRERALYAMLKVAMETLRDCDYDLFKGTAQTFVRRPRDVCEMPDQCTGHVIEFATSLALDIGEGDSVLGEDPDEEIRRLK
jgi:hypothetical protein